MTVRGLGRRVQTSDVGRLAPRVDFPTRVPPARLCNNRITKIPTRDQHYLVTDRTLDRSPLSTINDASKLLPQLGRSFEDRGCDVRKTALRLNVQPPTVSTRDAVYGPDRGRAKSTLNPRGKSWLTACEALTSTREPEGESAVRHSTVKVGPVTVFYREAGLEGRPVLLLLHGFANSSHYFRHLMPLLANRFHLIAPDLPSFGFTKVDGEDYPYTFAQLTQTTQGFVDALALRRFAMYVFDYGAPIGFNLAVADPGRITAIVSQNGNAYEEGLGEGPWAPLRAYWKQPSAAIRDQIKERMSLDGVREAYFQGVPDVSKIEPEAYWLDAALLAQPA